jgi:hypothetical protein
MFQFQPFTDAEIDADPRIAMLVEDKRFLLEVLQNLDNCDPATAEIAPRLMLARFSAVERKREADHYAALQAENVSRGWRRSTFNEILGLDPRSSAAEQEIENNDQDEQPADADERPADVTAAAPAIAAATENQHQHDDE